MAPSARTVACIAGDINPQELTVAEKCRDLFCDFFRQHQAAVTRCDANVILGASKHCFRHGYRAIARPDE